MWLISHPLHVPLLKLVLDYPVILVQMIGFFLQFLHSYYTYYSYCSYYTYYNYYNYYSYYIYCSYYTYYNSRELQLLHY